MPMQILHPFVGSVQQYLDQLGDAGRHRPDHCPQCPSRQPLASLGFYTRTIVDSTYDGVIRVRRYLCEACRRTVSLLPEFALPYLRSSITVIAVFLITRLLHGKTLKEALPPASPYQRGQSWIRRFRRQAEPLCAALSALIQPAPALNFVARALLMLSAAGWIPAHRFLFDNVRHHLLGWSRSLIPDGRRVTIRPAAAPA
jgi:transposase-like protein